MNVPEPIPQETLGGAIDAPYANYVVRQARRTALGVHPLSTYETSLFEIRTIPRTAERGNSSAPVDDSLTFLEAPWKLSVQL